MAAEMLSSSSSFLPLLLRSSFCISRNRLLSSSFSPEARAPGEKGRREKEEGAKTLSKPKYDGTAVLHFTHSVCKNIITFFKDILSRKLCILRRNDQNKRRRGEEYFVLYLTRYLVYFPVCIIRYSHMNIPNTVTGP